MIASLRVFLISAFLSINLYSQYISINVVSQPVFLLRYPCGVENVSITPLFDWTDVKGASSYHLQVFEQGSQIPYLEVYNIQKSEYQVLQKETLSMQSPFYWRVRTQIKDSFWGFSEFCYFVTA